VAEATPSPTTREPSAAEELGARDLLTGYRWMVLSRTVDERCLTLQRQGRIGFYVPLQGQEAAQVGCAMALRNEDWIFPAYRELAVALVRGIPLGLLLNQFYGNQGDEEKGRQMPNHYGYRRFNFVTASSPVGTQISQAVGAAMAARYKGGRLVTIAFFGDGTTSSNDFHAGLNFAGVYQTPTLFFCQNNQWAISLPRDRQTRSATLAEKAEAYGFPGVVVDGTDLASVYHAVREARERALRGEGPTLIEAQVYRLGPHSTSDDPRRYRTDAELNEWKAKDPLARLKKWLVDGKVLSEDEDHALWEAAKKTVAQAVEAAEALPANDPLTIFEDVYAHPSARLEAQRDEVAELLQKGVLKP
jgi:pyruvate dehydrogenase E1 component alpha subunit